MGDGGDRYSTFALRVHWKLCLEHGGGTYGGHAYLVTQAARYVRAFASSYGHRPVEKPQARIHAEECGCVEIRTELLTEAIG